MKIIIDDKVRNMGIKYKAREATKCIVTVFHEADMSPTEIYREQRGRCMFDMGVHFLVMPDGSVYSCIPKEAHADIVYERTEDGVYIMAVGASDEKGMTDAQKRAYDALMAELDADYEAPERIVEC